MFLDPEKIKQLPPECILLRPAGIPAHILHHRLLGQPSHESLLAPSPEKISHPALGCMEVPFLLSIHPPGCHYFKRARRWPGDAHSHPFPVATKPCFSYYLTDREEKEGLRQYFALFRGPALHCRSVWHIEKWTSPLSVIQLPSSLI